MAVQYGNWSIFMNVIDVYVSVWESLDMSVYVLVGRLLFKVLLELMEYRHLPSLPLARNVESGLEKLE